MALYKGNVPDFKSLASTNSATSAQLILDDLLWFGQTSQKFLNKSFSFFNASSFSPEDEEDAVSLKTK
jgi:hypothetical protein